MTRRSVLINLDSSIKIKAMPTPDATLSSAQAAALLGIKLETLYAYASRGLVKGLPGARGRGRRYRREDLEPLRTRSAGPAAGALRFGEPVLDTRITRMTADGPAYRGHLATDLVRDGVPFEAVAELLWTGAPPAAAPRVRWPGGRDLGPALDARVLAPLLPAGGPPLAAWALALPVLAAADPLRFDTRPEALLARARWLLPRLAASFALALDPRRLPAALDTGDPVLALAIALGLRAPTQHVGGRAASRAGPRGSSATWAASRDTRRDLELLRSALVLCADHDLNASTFAARVAASTGADLYACLAAALAAFSGPRHGGASEQVELLVQEAGTPERAAAAVGDRLRRGERLPGFGHPLYPEGDPRAALLLECALACARAAARSRRAQRPATAARRAPSARSPTVRNSSSSPSSPSSLSSPGLSGSQRLRTLAAVVSAVEATGRPRANLDVALAATCAALELPLGLGPAIFAVGRCAGWVAHVLEQQRSPSVLRPRARYVGETLAAQAPAGAPPAAGQAHEALE
jgi:citrate synthase